MKQKICLILSIIALLCLSACYPKIRSLSLSKEARYLVIGSDMLLPKGEILTFDPSGNRLDRQRMAISDIYYFSRDGEQAIYAAGHRSNNNLIIQDRQLESFFLLDDDRYSGSTAVLMDEKCTYSSMNGNQSDEVGYESLLVARDRKTGKTLYLTIVPLYATHMLAADGRIYLVGTNAGPNHDDAVIVVVNKETGQILDTFIYPEHREAFGIVRVADRMLVEMTRKSDLKQEFLIFNNGSLQSLETPVVHEMPIIDSDNEYLYVLADGILYQITSKGDVKQQVVLPNRSFRIDNTEIIGDDFLVYQLEIFDGKRATVHVNQYKRADFSKHQAVHFEIPRYDHMQTFRLMEK